MGIELEWFSLFVLHVLGSSIFNVFEVETPWWRLVLKWTVVAAITIGIYLWAGHWALLVVAIPAAAGTVFHFTWCRKHGIDPLNATPRRKYYELRDWDWVE